MIEHVPGVIWKISSFYIVSKHCDVVAYFECLGFVPLGSSEYFIFLSLSENVNIILC
jgi:hypothetical protein